MSFKIDAKFQVAAESGYNMVHFTPVQELGISNSAYSIRNQQVLSPVYSPGDKKYNLNDVKELMNYMNSKLGVSAFFFFLWTGGMPVC